MQGRFDWAKYVDVDRNSLDLSKDRTDPELLSNEDASGLLTYLSLHPDIHTLNLSGQNKLSVNSIKQLASVPSLKVLNLNAISHGDAVAKIFRNNTNILSLSLSAAKLQPASAAYLAANTCLQVLDVSLNKLGNGVSAFRDNHSIRELDVSYNKIKTKHAVQLARNSHLLKLNVSHNKIGPLGAIAFSTNTSIQYLNFASNQAGAIGASAFINNRVLLSLNLHYNQVGDKAAMTLAGHPTLQHLNLSLNELTPACALAFSDNTSLVNLDLSHNKIGDAIGLALRNSDQYIHLNLAATDITDATVMSIMSNHHLATLNIAGNPKLTIASIQAVLGFESLIDFDVANTKIGDDGAVLLATHPCIKRLRLFGADLNDRAAYALARNSMIKTLDVNWNDISVLGAIALHGNLLMDLDIGENAFNKPKDVIAAEDRAKLEELDPIKRFKNARALGASVPVPSLVALSIFALRKAQENQALQIDLATCPQPIRDYLDVKMNK